MVTEGLALAVVVQDAREPDMGLSGDKSRDQKAKLPVLQAGMALSPQRATVFTPIPQLAKP